MDDWSPQKEIQLLYLFLGLTQSVELGGWVAVCVGCMHTNPCLLECPSLLLFCGSFWLHRALLSLEVEGRSTSVFVSTAPRPLQAEPQNDCHFFFLGSPSRRSGAFRNIYVPPQVRPRRTVRPYSCRRQLEEDGILLERERGDRVADSASAARTSYRVRGGKGKDEKKN